jgi:hypothetical protein
MEKCYHSAPIIPGARYKDREIPHDSELVGNSAFEFKVVLYVNTPTFHLSHQHILINVYFIQPFFLPICMHISYQMGPKY